jgi:hypothetical protein
MKSTLLLLFVAVFFALNCNAVPKKKEGNKEKAAMNTLTNEEKTQGWLLMFDGKTSEGWKGYNKPNFPAGWIVENGTLKCQDSGRGEAGAANGGDIMYAKQKFSNFHLKLEWKISNGGNSGIFYLGREVEGWEIYRTAPEMQILDNDRHPDALLGKDGNRKAGSLYDLIPAKPQNTKPAGEWNSIEIICYQGTVVHKQNGETVLEYHLWTPEWNQLVKNSKFPELNPDWANVAKEGIIALQDHGNAVWFRNIKIRAL